MKKQFTTSILFFFILTLVNAQVKIGNNPAVINQNSLLELESTNKGVLLPRMPINNLNQAAPLTGTIPASMLVYSQGGSVQDGFYFWGGSGWSQIATSANVRSNYKLVKSAADFPAAAGGIITLSAGTLYEINGSVVVTDKINLNGCTIKGLDPVNDKLIYAGSAELFTGSEGGNISYMTMISSTAGSKLFNLDALGANKNLIIHHCYILGCDNIGNIKNFGGNVYMETIGYFSNNNGVTYQDNTNLIIFNALWDNSNKNTYEKLSGAFSVVQILGGDRATLSGNGAIALDVTGITSLSAGSIKTLNYTGNGTYVNGSFSKQWEVESYGLTTEKDDVSAGNIYLTAILTTSFTAANTPTKILGTTTPASLFRVSMPTNNRLTYTGTKTKRFQVICSLSAIAAGNNKNFSFYIVKNGSILSESRQSMKLSATSDRGSITLSCTTALASNDYIEVWVENDSDATGINIETLNLSAK